MTNARNYRVPTADDDADVPKWNGYLADDVAKDVDALEDTVAGSRFEGRSTTTAGGFVDESGRETWLMHDTSGGPTPYAAAKMIPALKPGIGQEVADRGLVELPARGLAGGFIDTNGRETWLMHDTSGGPTPYAAAKMIPALKPGIAQEVAGLGLAELPARGISGGFIDTNGRETDLVFGPDGHVTDRVIGLWAPRLSAALNPPVVTAPARVAWGHSLVQGNTGGAVPWTTELSSRLGITITNRGINGQYSRAIAARNGGNPALAAVSGGSIPASGPVAVTLSTDPQRGTGRTVAGTIAGIPGSLVLDAQANDPVAEITGTFTRTTDGAAKAVPMKAPFILDTSATTRVNITYIWAMRNDVRTDATTRPIGESVENTARIAKYSTEPGGRFLVFEEPPWDYETTGTTARTALNAANDALRAAFPANWIPIASWLRTAEAAAVVGLTYTADDQTDIANGITPRSFRVDQLHFNTLGNKAIAYRIHQEEIARGWI